MLGKQGWRLLRNPNSLLSRTLKARYFKRGNFLSACEGYNPSFTWKSILDGRELLKEGLEWVLGNCHAVSVWGEPWVSTRLPSTLPSPEYQIDESLTVRDLLLDDYSDWDRPLLGALFDEEIKASILAIPLCRLESSDHLVWKFERSGMYSVRSAYKVWVAKTSTDNTDLVGSPSSK
ncbi:hypothetical protein ACS0TY_030700 [Phlomoides rotata]